MKTTTEPESKDAKSQERGSVTDKGPRPSDGFPDPDFPIEGSGGPIDGDGDPHAEPTKRQQ